jgi:hypothetical protein
MSFRLSNQNNPDQALSMSSSAWFDIITLAEDHGWNPMGPVNDAWSVGVVGGYPEFKLERPDPRFDSYDGDTESLVLMDDALNLADALDRAFMESDPHPSLEYLPGYENGGGRIDGSLHAGIGVIQIVKEFCYQGAFWIERL